MNHDNIFFNFVVITCVVVFILTLLLIILNFIPKFRAKIVGLNVKTAKYVQDENKETLKELSQTSGEMVGAAAQAIKDELNIDFKECSSCGKKIPADSEFCNKCGEKQ